MRTRNRRCRRVRLTHALDSTCCHADDLESALDTDLYILQSLLSTTSSNSSNDQPREHFEQRTTTTINNIWIWYSYNEINNKLLAPIPIIYRCHHRLPNVQRAGGGWRPARPLQFKHAFKLKTELLFTSKSVFTLDAQSTKHARLSLIYCSLCRRL